MAQIRFEKVTKRYGTVKAVDEVSLVAEDKEFMVLVGPSGCGKTTTLRMIAGLEQADEGDIYVGERRVNDLPPKDRNVAMVFQDYALYPHMSVYKNMSFGLRQRKHPEPEIRRRVNEAAKVLGIEELLDRRPKQLSGGQRQRVAMGRAIVRDPLAFLFDEPLSNLDAQLRVQMRKELVRLHERLENTIVYVTHDQIEAMTLADKIVIMNRGKIMQVGGPMEVFNSPGNIFVAGFIGSPTMNLFDVSIIQEDGRPALIGEGFKLPVPPDLHNRLARVGGRSVILGIRPQHIFDADTKKPFAGGELIEATIEIVEPVGTEVIIYGNCGPAQLTACLTPKTLAAPHRKWKFLIDMNQVHLFDKSTGEAFR